MVPALARQLGHQLAKSLALLQAQQALSPITFLPLPDVDTPEHRLVAQLIAEDVVGEVTSVECHRGHRGPTHADWFYRQDLSGGGALIDLGVSILLDLDGVTDDMFDFDRADLTLMAQNGILGDVILHELGHALETAVLNELERRKAEVGYVKNAGGFEVDFHVRYLAGAEELVQVCADPSAPATMDRELRALALAEPAHPRATRRLLTLTRDQTIPMEVSGVSVQPAYEWMLAEPEVNPSLP